MMVRAHLAELQVAMMLLTRLPAGRVSGEVPGMAASCWAWPIAGAVIGGVSAAGFAGFHAIGCSAPIAALLTIAIAILATGGMHEDGLADFADGCGGGNERARKLEIMRDSRIGTYGVLALLISIGLRGVAMAELATPVLVVPALITLAMASRAVLPLWLMVLPTARAEGLGHDVCQPGFPRVAVATLFGLVGLTLLPAAIWPVALFAVLSGSAVIALIALRQLGGQTGDVLGATQQVSEIFGWLALTLFLL